MALLQLVELLERERVDRAEQAQLAVELADTAGGGGALGQRRLLGAPRRPSGSMSRSRRSVSTAFSSRSLASASSMSARWARWRVSSSCRSASWRCLAAQRRARSVSARTSSLWRRRCSLSAVVLDLDHLAVAVDQRGQPVDRDDRALDLAAPLGGHGPRLDVGLEAALGLGDPLLEELLTLVQAGVAHLELAAPRREHRGTRLELGAGLAAAPWRPSASASSSASSAGSTASSSAIRPRSTAMWPVRSADRCGRGASSSAASSRRWPSTRARAFGRGGEAGVVLVETRGVERRLVPTCRPRAHVAWATASSCSAGCERSSAGVARCLGLVERRRRGPAGRGADAPAGGANRSPATVTTTAPRMVERGVDRRVERRRRRTAPPTSDVEQPGDVRRGRTARAGAPARRPPAVR